MDKLKPITYLVIIVLPLTLFVAGHEATHLYFAHEHDCQNISLNGPDLSGEWWHDSIASVSYGDCQDLEELNLKQEIVEAVGYQKMVEILLMSFILLVVLTNQWKLMKIDSECSKKEEA